MLTKSIKLSLAIAVLFAAKANAQNVAINETAATANTSAMLDVQSTTKGLLAPRMTQAQRNAIASPATGLLIYQTDNTPGFYYFQGSEGWIRLNTGTSGGGTTGGDWSLSGNTLAEGQFIGTTNYQDVVFKANNVIVGRLKVPGGSGAIMFGENADAAQNSVALGTDAKASSYTSVALGKSANASGDGAMVIGLNAKSIASNHAVVIGTDAKSEGEQNIVLGKGAASTGSSQGIAIGSGAKTTTYRSIAIGATAEVNSNSDAIALGVGAKATGYRSVAIGSEALSTKPNSIILGNTTAQVGIGTSAPVDGVKLDVHGTAKLGANGTAIKNIVTGIQNGAYAGLTATGSADVIVTLNGSTSSTNASVSVAPAVDLPNGVVIAYARMISNNQVKIRLYNTTGTATSFSSTWYVTVTEF